MALKEDFPRRNSFVENSLSSKSIRAMETKTPDLKRCETMSSQMQSQVNNFKSLINDMFEMLLQFEEQFSITSSQNLKIQELSKRREELLNGINLSLFNVELPQKNSLIIKLQTELDMCKQDLKNDEEIFAEKAKQISSKDEELKKLKSKFQEMADLKEEYFDRIQNQDDQLIAQQIALEDVHARMKEYESQADDSDLDFDEPDNLKNTGSSRQRAQSVPVHKIGNRSEKLKESYGRNIRSSPAVFSLERVMANFRARSQMLINRIEDDDEVNQSIVFNEEEENINHSKMATPENIRNTHLRRNTPGRGTYRVSKAKLDKNKMHANDTGIPVSSKAQNILEVNPASPKSTLHEKKLKKTESAVRQSTKKLQDLSLNIKLKEQLIKEMADKHNQTQERNTQYEHKIQLLEKDKKILEHEIQSLQKCMKDIETKDKAEKDVLQSEFRRKMEIAMKKLQTANQKQHEAEKISTLTGGNKTRIQEQELEIDKMKSQLKSLHKSLKEEGVFKTNLEREVEKEKNRISQLQALNEQQKKVLKVKTEEAAAVRKRYRSNSAAFSKDDMNNIVNKQKMLDLEIEKTLEHKKELENLQKELENREEDLASREKLIEEKNKLEIKKLRSSKMISQDIISDKENIKEEDLLGKKTSKNAFEMNSLTNEIDKLKKKREIVCRKLEDGQSLSKKDEQRLIEIEEIIAGLDTTINNRNQSVKSLRNSVSNFVRDSISLNQSQDDNSFLLNALNLNDCKALLKYYIDKIIELKSSDNDFNDEIDKLQSENEEQQQVIDKLESTLEQTKTELDRKLNKQQAEHDMKIHELIEQSEHKSHAESVTQELKLKIKTLEKDLFYYKTKSREFKKTLMESQNNMSSRPTSANKEKELTPAPHPPTENSHHSEYNSSNRLPSVSVSSPRRSTSAMNNNLEEINNNMKNNSLSESTHSERLKISRKDFRKMNNDELTLRLSNSSTLNLKDSLDDTN